MINKLIVINRLTTIINPSFIFIVNERKLNPNYIVYGWGRCNQLFFKCMLYLVIVSGF